ncbi:MAG: undecaprenyl-diphosphate phosphatase [Candidatus Izemoplasmatales bacterium]|jgi:undecaprenyl-diphosphatase|nr:undecaprenyl-diphosphate phosphatase [Candidatus Izemoplasmatales bacterium]MDD4354535.1 undecaprenyl-diphosphate phosphatase [Candidatus Izemoplasmatales bacterium]MDD4987767.1 undecaprenyl-diphosphate phosphatase [Candidatus Izemoplasmatales bacterium]MDD5601801.1 undecaprenyl-diphosphate phosphatase [Candidatus Izemoplasmatales bacterium]MDY0372810.1 undecaprenyl-diphosphate phosphatase [Candidatus Izemoplasmatales bacterium]
MNLLEALKYLLLGLVQGVTEVLPISSSGHVELVQTLVQLEADEGLLFLILVNTGSLIVFLFIYWRKLWRVLLDFLSYIFRPSTREATSKGFYYAIKLVIASIPAAIVGVFFKDQLDALLKSHGLLVSGTGLILTGSVLLIVSQKRAFNGEATVSFVDAILMGLGQAAALFPGVSRSGMTTSTGISRGIGIATALDFSFMMYIPVSIGVLLLSVIDGIQSGFNLPGSDYIGYYLLALVGAIVATYLAFRIVFSAFKTGKLKYFALYCLAVGLLSIGIYIF